MLAYKFRSPTQIEFALDILFKNRLHCADWKTLTDPMKRVFAFYSSSTDTSDHPSFLDDVEQEKKNIKICSLSTTFNSHLLWAHYADGFAGMAIEIDFPDEAPDFKRVKYGGVFATADIKNERIPSTTARHILSSKYMEWVYEKEIRILHKEEWFTLYKPVSRIIVGHQMNPSLFEFLCTICENMNITINRTGIGDEGIDADSVLMLGEPC